MPVEIGVGVSFEAKERAAAVDVEIESAVIIVHEIDGVAGHPEGELRVTQRVFGQHRRQVGNLEPRELRGPLAPLRVQHRRALTARRHRLKRRIQPLDLRC